MLFKNVRMEKKMKYVITAGLMTAALLLTGAICLILILKDGIKNGNRREKQPN